jgi:hypothetical protein
MRRALGSLLTVAAVGLAGCGAASRVSAPPPTTVRVTTTSTTLPATTTTTVAVAHKPVIYRTVAAGLAAWQTRNDGLKTTTACAEPTPGHYDCVSRERIGTAQEVATVSDGVATWYAIVVGMPRVLRTFFVKVSASPTTSTTPPTGATVATCLAAVRNHFFPNASQRVQFGADGYGVQAVAYQCGNEDQLFTAMDRIGSASEVDVSQMVSDVCGAVADGTLCLHLSDPQPAPTTTPPTTTRTLVVNTAAVEHEIAVQLGQQVAETLTVSCPQLYPQSSATCQTSGGLPIVLKVGLRTVTWGSQDVEGIVKLVFAS